MPEYSSFIQSKLSALAALPADQRKPAELVCVYWPSGKKVYAIAPYDQMAGYSGLPARLASALAYTDPVIVSLIPGSRMPFTDLPKTAAIGDDQITLEFSDLDDAFSTLLYAAGSGVRVEVFGYWPGVDLLLSLWRGSLHTPKSFNRQTVKITAAAGFRSAQLQIPRQPNATSCPHIFGALLTSQAEIDYHQGCPYNKHLGGAIGAPGFTDCPRRTINDCSERLLTENYWPGVETRPDPVANNQTKGANLLAHAYGNESALNDPIRVIAGHRHVKALSLLAFRPELNNNQPEKGFGAALFEVSVGPVESLWGFRINDQLVGDAHQQKKLGALGQTPTTWSPDVNSYSGIAHAWGRIQGNFNGAGANDFTGSIYCKGLNNLRIYISEVSFSRAYTTNRMWWILEMYCNPKWGYGVDYARVLISSTIDTAQWCDESVSHTDPNGNVFEGVRSTFNAELTARATQQQIKDACVAGRIGLPFEWDGKDCFVPLRTENLASVPTFSDEGADRNIVYDGALSSLEWSQVSDAELTNQWTLNFDDAGNGFVDTQLLFGDQVQQLRAGRAWGDRTRRVVNKSQAAFGITNAQEAARIGNSLLYLGPLDEGGVANNFRVKFTTWHSFCRKVHPYKVIRVLDAKLQQATVDYYGARNYSWWEGDAYQYFRVLKITRKGDLKVEIEAQLYPEDYYAAVEGAGGMCSLTNAGSISYIEEENVQVGAGNTLTKTGGVEGAADAYATHAYSFSPARCSFIAWEITEAGAGGSGYEVWVEDEEGNHRFGWHFFMFAGSAPAVNNIVEGVYNVGNSFFGIDPGIAFGIRLTGTQVRLQASLSAPPLPPPEGSWSTLHTFPLPQDARYVLRVVVFSHETTVPDIKVWDSESSYQSPDLTVVEQGPELTLGQETLPGTLTPEITIRGTITFPASRTPLRAKVYVTPPGGTEADAGLGYIAPPFGSQVANFFYPATVLGLYAFRVVAETATNPPSPKGEDTATITAAHPVRTQAPPAAFSFIAAGGSLVYTIAPPATGPAPARCQVSTANPALPAEPTSAQIKYDGPDTKPTEVYTGTLASPTVRYARAIDATGNKSTWVTASLSGTTLPAPTLAAITSTADSANYSITPAGGTNLSLIAKTEIDLRNNFSVLLSGYPVLLVGQQTTTGTLKLAPGTYYLKVRYIDHTGTAGTWSAIATVVIGTAAGLILKEQDGSPSITVDTIEAATGDFTVTDLGSNDARLALAPTGVAPGVYGSITQIPQVTVDAKGRITTVTTITITNTEDAQVKLIVFEFGDGVNPLAANVLALIPELPWDCVVNKARILGDVSGSAVVNVKQATYAAYPMLTSICASAKPTLSSQAKNEPTLTGWTVALAKGNVLAAALESFTTVKKVAVSLKVSLPSGGGVGGGTGGGSGELLLDEDGSIFGDEDSTQFTDD